MKRKLTIFVTFVIFSLSVFANDCPQFYANGQIPITTKNYIHICKDRYAVGYSTEKKVAYWSAEKLTKEDLFIGRNTKRKDSFHAEVALMRHERSDLNSYNNSGYDRGHLTPDRNYPSSYDVDSLINIVPQEPGLNRGRWARLESDVRKMAEKEDLFIITGTMFIDTDKKIGNGIYVPSHLFKIVKTKDRIYVYVAKNERDSMIEQWSLFKLESAVLITFFPDRKSFALLQCVEEILSAF